MIRNQWEIQGRPSLNFPLAYGSPILLPPSPSPPAASAGPIRFDVNGRDLMAPVPEAVCGNLAEIRHVPIDHETFPTETNVAIGDSARAAKYANRRNPVAPVAGSAQIIQAFAV